MRNPYLSPLVDPQPPIRSFPTVMSAQGVGCDFLIATCEFLDCLATPPRQSDADALRRTDCESILERSLSCKSPHQVDERRAIGTFSYAQLISAAHQTVTEKCRKEINSGKENQLANLEHPIDIVVTEFAALKRDLAAEFLEDDGVICEREAAILARFAEGKRRIGRSRAFARATELAMKQEGKYSDYTNRQFAIAGAVITPIKPAVIEAAEPLDAA